MKKSISALSCCLALCVIFFSLFLSACQPKFDSFIEGEYVTTNEVDNDIISKIRLELYNIDEQTYSKSNGVNVVCDFTKSGADKYFSFNLYLFVDELGEYCKIDLTNFEHLSHSPTYYCYPADKEVSSAISGIYNISAIAFEYIIGKYDTWFDVLLHQNGMEYYYQLSLVNNDDEDITVEGIDKTDPYTWFDVNKTDLPSLKECHEITEGMSLNQVIRKIGKPQRDIGYGTMILQFDVDDGSVFTVSFLKGKDDPAVADYDKWVVFAADFDTEIPDVYFPYYGTLNDLHSWIENDLYSWIDELNVEEIVEVRYEQSFTSVAPGRLKDIAYSTNNVDIENTYRLLFSPLTSISEEEGKIEGGGYVRYDFTTANNKTYSITVENDIVIINNYYFKFVDNFYYAFQYSDVDCNSFITYDTPIYDEYEIYTYANESVKIGDYDGLGEFEFKVYDGLIENAPSYYLKSSAVDLLILSDNQFMIEGKNNTIVYQITGNKNFSFLF